MAPTYETAPIRQFYHGRTETMRTCTNEAFAWCKAMDDPTVDVSRYLSSFTSFYIFAHFFFGEYCFSLTWNPALCNTCGVSTYCNKGTTRNRSMVKAKEAVP